MGQAALGNTVMLNRVAKFAGGFVWLKFARAVQAGRASHYSARALVAACVAVLSACTLLIATVRSSSVVLQASLAVCGLAYGVADGAFVQLTVWSSREPALQRQHVAAINVGFTVGALLPPTVIAAALRAGYSTYSGFYALSLLGAVPLKGRKMQCVGLAMGIVGVMRQLVSVPLPADTKGTWIGGRLPLSPSMPLLR